MRRILWISSTAVIASSLAIAQKPAGQRDPAQSPASQRPPQTLTSQTYSTEQIQAGELRFTSQCGFCHGRDAAGGETGPDLTRSKLVAEDHKGDKIGLLVRAGRPDQGMPAFTLSDADLAAIVAFIHDQKTKAESLEGGRRAVADADLATGDAAAGRRYFNATGGCSACHSTQGDLAGVASRYQGLELLMRMLYPGGQSAPAPADALSAHFDQLAKYTDDDMHNVYAYLVTLK
jgi:cytochrome c oxidase cbb3-type subunit III